MENPTPSIKKWTKKKVAFVVGSFLLFILVIALVSGGGDSTDQTTQQEAKQTTASLKTGEEGYLRIEGQQQVLVATSKANFEKLIKLSVANDNLGLAKMTVDGEAYFVDSNTKVLVISSSVGSREIRILEGSQFSNSGWVPAEFIFKDKK